MDYIYHIHIGASCFNLPWKRMKNAKDNERFVLFEPNPEVADLLQKDITKLGVLVEGNVKVYGDAISTFNGMIDLQSPDYSQFDMDVKDNEWIWGISNVRNPANTGKDLLSQQCFAGKTTIHRVECFTLDTALNKLLDHHGKDNVEIGSMIIDIEGHDFDIIRSYSFRYKPRFLKVEYKHCTIPVLEIVGLLGREGYEVFFETEDLYAYC